MIDTNAAWIFGERGSLDGEVSVFRGRGRFLEEDGIGSNGKEVSSSLVTTTLIGGGVGRPKVGKYFKISSLNQLTTSGEARVSKIYSFNLGLKEEYSTGKFSKSKFLETSAEGRRGELDIATGVLKVESCK